MYNVIVVYRSIYIQCIIVFQDEGGQASIFTGEEEVFAFERTISRLQEMQGEEYWHTRDRDHAPSLADRDR